MFEDLILFHRPGGQGTTTLAADLGLDTAPSGEWFYWQTCLRQIALTDCTTDSNEVSSLLASEHDEVYSGDEAYRFILEIICGLHSPMVGETEVYGQFKTAIATFPAARGSRLQRVFRALLEDAKAVRQAHLIELGSQSYGSVLRRELNGLQHLDVIGAGQFVKDLLPWLRKDGNEISLVARNPLKAEAAFPDVPVRAMQSVAAMVAPEAIVIAAPISAADFIAWMKTSYLDAGTTLRCIVDLRADSSSDSISATLAAAGLQAAGLQLTNVRVVELSHVFAHLSQNQELIEKRKVLALRAIAEVGRERGAHVEYRPFGWEDVCA